MQPEMMPAAFASLLLLAAMISIVVGSIMVWGACRRSWRRGVPAVPFEPRTPVPWSVLDLLVVLLILAATEGTTAVAAYWLNPGRSPGDGALPIDIRAPDARTIHEVPGVAMPLVQEESEAGSAAGISFDDVPPLLIGRLLGPLLALAFLKRSSGATWNDFGFSTERLGSDLRLGVLAFVAIAPPVYALQGLLQYIFPGQHPMLELIEEKPTPFMLATLSFLIVIVAPLTEELIIRVFLQGWLERFSAQDVDEPRRLPVGLVPILISSVIFAALHAGHGPDPVPIFILALSLGYLYSRTHRIWPGLALHMSLNAASTVALLLALAIGEQPA
ncbi:MAG: CPBP family intramembrane metalloprotease [Pirellulales bacterium]|nr:CPBP family intramembrane metalloprotease [Pirellulales bacterium]